MPIEVVTGLPGNGKTLFTVCNVRERALKENRPVFYDGIEILDKEALPWQPISGEKWFEAPPGAIVVIDEAQRIFRPRANGSAVPLHVEKLETHRHMGVDLVLITQDAMLLDANVRKLTQHHRLIVRRYGFQAAAWFLWQGVRTNTAGVKVRKEAQEHGEWKYNKKAYGWYKSAEVHTVKARIPPKLIGLAFMLLLVPLAVFMVFRFYKQSHDGVFMSSAVPAGAVASSPLAMGGPVAQRDPVMTRAEYVKAFEPRVVGLAYTAPVYDKVTQPVRAPYPAACVQSKTRCQCYTQQGTRLDVTVELCKGIAEGGFFMAWDEKAQQAMPQPLPVSTAPKLGGGNVDGLINLTPGHTAKGTQVALRDTSEEDGRALAGARAHTAATAH